ncbi:nuclear transport factor 2 family protein [Pseudonocardia parietis]|uniref:SnoaL-like domain-containing protein n=1 Tax=Pseudonocardia parietis TaxID=570936 RepID=A0ABS4VUN9_9PSEU|nr:nuclear transport factor 2 family protein [Pseudonocardia parietis]MBP2367653.1 hypothetical protein [Pseudonocardia parietis]
MTGAERLAAVEAIKVVKARYFRGVDTNDGALVRSVLHPDCVLDYRGCTTDPASGRDLVPSMNRVLEGRESWPLEGSAGSGVVSVHQGHQVEVTLTGDTTAEAIWSMSDRMFMPPGAPVAQLLGYGWYHETYERVGDEWLIRTLRIQRIRVEAG